MIRIPINFRLTTARLSVGGALYDYNLITNAERVIRMHSIKHVVDNAIGTNSII